MTGLKDIDKKQIWAEVQQEFPDDEMMQASHYVRLLHYHQVKNLSSQERIQFFNKVLFEEVHPGKIAPPKAPSHLSLDS